MARKNSSKLNSCNPLFLALLPPTSVLHPRPVFFPPRPPVCLLLAVSFIRRNSSFFLSFSLFFFTLFLVVRVLNIEQRGILCFSVSYIVRKERREVIRQRSRDEARDEPSPSVRISRGFHASNAAAETRLEFLIRDSSSSRSLQLSKFCRLIWARIV